MRVKIELDRKGVSKVAKGREMQKVIGELTEEVAAHVRSQGQTVGAFHGGGQIPLPVETSTSVSDRARGRVTLAHPAGLAVVAKHGVLWKAAAAVGLKVQSD